MIITTIQDVPGMEIVEYRGLATGEVVAGINVVKDIGAGLRNLFGGESKDTKMKLFKQDLKL